MTTGGRAQDVTFVLVRPRYPGNIGSAARALKNMGFSKLALVRPTVLPIHPEARRLAVKAEDLLKKAKVFETIEEATQGLHFLVGTTRRTGKYRRDFVPLPELAGHLPPGRQKIGILFGAEERGLTNRELALCHLVTTIPTNPDFPSLNLAQAVMIIAYQLAQRWQSQTPRSHRGEIPLSPRFPPSGLATIDQLEGMYHHLEEMLAKIGFFPHKNAFHMMRTLRQLFGRTGLIDREVRVIRGICRQVSWATGGGKDF